MRKIRPLLAAFGLLAAAFLVSCGPSRGAAPRVPVSPQVLTDQLKKAGMDIPTRDVMSEDFTLDALDGTRVSLSSFKGKVVLLSFWATWCGPCKQEMPEMQTLYQKLKGRGFEVVAVDMMEDKATVSEFVKRTGYTFPVLLDTTGEVGGAGLYSARAIPTNYVIDKTGKIVGRKIGIDGPGWTSAERAALFESLLTE
jgi:thiol-disulfide isomerase/thioredoxin